MKKRVACEHLGGGLIVILFVCTVFLHLVNLVCCVLCCVCVCVLCFVF